MLKFVNKKGHTVMETKDNGEILILNENLQKSFDEKKPFKEISEGSEENQDK
jgi:hypothetical protein